MQTREIPREQWQQFFDDFSEQHRNWKTSIEVMGQDIGHQPQVQDAPLQGISFEPVGTEIGDIEVAVGDSPDDFQLHRIEKPEHVRMVESQPGRETDIEVDSGDGMTTLFRIRLSEQLPDMH